MLSGMKQIYYYEWWMGKDSDGRNRIVIHGTITAFTWRKCI